MHDAAARHRPITSLGATQLFSLLGLIVRREGANITALIANSLLLPAFICYAAFMLAPEAGPLRLRWAIGGLVLALGTMALNQTYFAVATDRLLGGLRLLSVNGVRNSTYVAAYLAYAVILGSIVTCGGVVFLQLAGLLHADLGSVLKFIAICQLASVSLGAIGISIGLLVRSFGMGDVVSNSAGMLAVAVSPVFYPIALVPAFLRPFVELSPYTQVATSLGSVASGGSPEPMAFLFLGVTAFVATCFALFAMQRTSA
jgi:ABC-type multidrug transport system permease subunit